MKRRSDREKKSHKDTPNRSAPKSGGSGFSFVDRSGKTHVIAPRTGHSAASATSRAPEPRGGGKPQREVLLPDEAPRFVSKRGKTPPKASEKERAARDRFRGEPKSNPSPWKPSKRSSSSRNDQPRHERGGAPVLAKAIVDKNRRGFAFLSFEDRKREDAFVPPHEASALFHGDRVEVELSHKGEVLDLRILEHRFREIFGRYQPHPGGRGGYVIYERKRAREEVYAPNNTVGAKADDWVRAKIEFSSEGTRNATANILATYGDTLPASIDVEMIAAEYNLIEGHPEAAEREAREFKLEITPALLKEREDLRHVPFITIDGETARDFDDAIYVERDGKGFILWVAIADVSHYVKPGTALDADALSRATSVYFPERAFHMLPRALSENLCSLKPNEPRLSMVAKMGFDARGTHESTELYEGLIQSQRRATYTEISNEHKDNKNNPKWEYAPHFALYDLLRQKRRDRGSIDFDLPEAEVVVDSKGEPIKIAVRERLDAHRLIEEFMIAANEAVTEWMMSLKDPAPWPFVYRVHDEPAETSIDRFLELANTVGAPLSLGSNGSIHQQLARFIERIEGHPAQALLNQQMLRSMKQAVYSAAHGEHFGLASKAYTHFTSPIRRYPDLVVHRMLRWALGVQNRVKRKPTVQDLKERGKELEQIVEHCSYRERLAAEADREANKLKQTRMMMKHLGEEFEGKINGITDAGLFVALDNPYCEGLLNKETLMDDLYEFKEDKMILIGRRTRRQFKIGERIEVRVIAADLDRRQVDFGPLDFDMSTLSLERQASKRPDFKSEFGGKGKSFDRSNRRPRSRSDERDSSGGQQPFGKSGRGKRRSKGRGKRR